MGIIGWLTSHGVRILVVVAISAGIYYLLRRLIPPLIRRTVAARMKGKLEEEIVKRSDTLSHVLLSTILIILVIGAGFTILAEVGVNIGPALAGLGIAGIAIGFGAQSLVRDFINGLFILLENHYDTGDVVTVAGISGLVEEVNLRRTILRDLNGIVHVIPNGEIRVASNFTRDYSRVNLNIPVAFGEDLYHVIEVINRVGNELAQDPKWKELILKPPQVLRVDNFGDSAIEIKVLGDTRPIRQWDVMGELRKRLKKVFDEEGIEIPWPHTKVYFGDLPPTLKGNKD